MIFDENLADNADFRFPLRLVDRQDIEIVDNLLQIPSIFEIVAVGKFFLGARHPCLIEAFCRTCFNFVRRYPIFDTHQKIAVNNRFDDVRIAALAQNEVIRFTFTTYESKSRHLSVSGIFQRRPHQIQVICRTARTASLKQHDCRLVRITSAGAKHRKHLTNDDDGWITHIVVYVPKPNVDCFSIHSFRNHKAIAITPKYVFQKLKVNRGHLRRKDCMRLLAFLRKMRTFFPLHPFIRDSFFAGKRRHQGADTNSRSAQIRHFVQLDHRVETTMRFQDFFDLSGSNRVQSTAKRTKLNQSDIVMTCGKTGGVIKTRVIAPLVDDAQCIVAVHR